VVTDTKTVTSGRQECLTSLSPYQGLQRLLEQKRVQLHHHYTLFIEQGGEETLHDFRVSVRRLRSLLKNYRNVTSDTESLSEQLRSLQQLTNQARDLEVFTVHLKHYCPQQPLLIEPFTQQRDEAYRQLRRELPPRWEKLQPRLQRPIATLPVAASEHTLGRLTRRIGMAQLDRMERGLTALHKSWDEVRVHRLRIRGKQLRYLLEPFSDVPGVDAALSALKTFQERMGDYRDLQLLEQHLTALQGSEDSSQALEQLVTSIQRQVEEKKAKAIKYCKLNKQYKLLSRLKAALRQLQR
jgi:CHAD domain-containing protein